MSLPQILVIDQEANTATVLERAFTHQARVIRAQSISQAEHLLAAEEIAVIVCRDDLPEESGIMFLTRFESGPFWQRRILLCPQANTELTLFLINQTPIFRCLAQPLEPAILVQAVEVALHESRRIHRLLAAEAENTTLKQELSARTSSGTKPIGEWFKTLPRLVGVVVFSFAGIFVLGVITLLALYLLKTLLGIDLIPGAHLSDALPQ